MESPARPSLDVEHHTHGPHVGAAGDLGEHLNFVLLSAKNIARGQRAVGAVADVVGAGSGDAAGIRLGRRCGRAWSR